MNTPHPVSRLVSPVRLLPARLSALKTLAIRLAPACVLLATSGAILRGATYTWDAGGGDLIWNNAVNWSGDALPVSGDTVQFTSAVTSGATISLGASQSASVLNINSYSGVPSFTIGSAADIVDGYTLTLTNFFRGDNNGNTQTIAANVVLGGNSTWNIVNGYNGSVAVTGNISGVGMSLTKTGTNSLTLSGANTYSGGTTISGGTLVLGNGTTNGTVVGDIVNNAALTINNVFDQTMGNISGSGSITKSGAGTLTLAGSTSGTSSGSFTINGGGLDAGVAGLALANSSYTWGSGFTFVGTNSMSLGTGAVTLGSNSTVMVKANTLSVGGAIGGAGRTLTKSGSGTLQLSGANTYSGGTTVRGGVLKLTAAGTAGTGGITVGAGGTLNLDNASANANRIGDSAAVNLGGTIELVGNASAATSETAGVLTPASGAAVLTLAPGADQSALMTFSSIGNRAVGNTTLYRGTGLGAALGANTSNIIFTAAPAVSTSGTFAATDGVGTLGTTQAAVLRGALADTTATGVGSGFATYDSAANGVRLLGAAEQDSSGTYPASNGNSNVRLNLTGATTITGVTSNTLQLDNTSGSVVTVTNTGVGLNPQNGLLFTGTSAITLTGGTYTQPVGTGDLVVLSTNSAGVTIGSILSNLGTTASTMGVTVGGSGNITLNGAIRLAASGSASSGTQYFNVNNSGTTTLASTVSGGGSASSNAATLVTNVNAGTLKLATGGSLGSVVQTNGGGTLGVFVVLDVATGAIFDLSGINSTISYLNSSGAGTITNTSGTTATLKMLGQASASGFYYNDITGSSSNNITGNLNVYIGNNFTNYRTFKQTLSGDNSYTGTTTLDLGYPGGSYVQALYINSATALGVGTFIIKRGSFDNSSGSAILMTANNAQQWNGSFSFLGTNNLNLGTGGVTLGTVNATVTVAANTLTVGGNIGDGGLGYGITKAGTGTLVLGGTNTYTGTTTVNAGDLTVKQGATLSADSAALAVNNGNTGAGTTVSLRLNSAQTVGSLSGSVTTASSGTNVAQIVLTGANTVLTANQTVAGTFGGVLTGNGGLKLGSGSTQALTLTNANTYTGATTINGGSLIVNGSLASGSAVAVNAGGTLGGSGTIAGVVTVNSGGFLAPGNSPGVLTVGSLNLASGSTTSLEIAGSAVRGTDFDGITVSTASGLTYGGTLSFAFTSTLTNGNSLDLFSFTGTATGSFTSVVSTGTYAGSWTSAGSTWTLDSGGQLLTFDQATGDLMVAASAVPEPSTFALLGGVMALGFAVTRRSRRR